MPVRNKKKQKKIARTLRPAPSDFLTFISRSPSGKYIIVGAAAYCVGC